MTGNRIHVSVPRSCITFIFVLISATWPCRAFTAHPTFVQKFSRQRLVGNVLQMAASSAPPSSSFPLSQQQVQQRKRLLSNNGQHFRLDRFSGKVEFGSTANLVTKFPSIQNDGDQLISQWLLDTQRVMMSIWDKTLLTSKGNSVFELKVMTLQFVTITLAPSVNVKAWTHNDEASSDQVVFYLHSVGFDPNIEILPGIGLSAKDLGVDIQVVGEMKPTSGNGVSGRIAFRSSGLLPPPMRLLPEAVLKGASSVINDTVTKFAIQSFQKGAIENFREFVAERKEQQQQQQELVTSTEKESK